MDGITEIMAAAWQAVSGLEIVSTGFGLAYIILATRENSWCWPAAFISTGTAISLFWDASLLMESALNIYYLAMAVFGWWQWQYGSQTQSKLAISSWGIDRHLLALSLIAALTLGSGYLLSHQTDAALPYVDSFTTWSAVITTWMIARKILENWLYWVVIDIVSIGLYVERELYLYASLYAVYVVIAGLGYIQWRKNYQRANAI